MDRRGFLLSVGSCCAHVFGLAAYAPRLTRKIFRPQDGVKIVAEEKWGRLEEVKDGVWNLISTPFESRDFTTVCNGGVIEGRDGVLVVEAFMMDAGAKWLADQALKLTGKRPTDVVCTHYHGDHANGHAGFTHEKGGPNIWLTESTRKAAEEKFKTNESIQAFKNVKELSPEKPTEIDLGGRKINVVPRRGHTESDVTIELVDPSVIWTGDLFFNGMFPNYKDAIPSKLNSYVEELASLNDTLIVPGHGPVAEPAAVKSYKEFLLFVQHSATKSHKAGKPAEEGAKEFQLPANLEEWLVWSPDVVKNGYLAWYRELDSTQKPDSKSQAKIPATAGGKQ